MTRSVSRDALEVSSGVLRHVLALGAGSLPRRFWPDWEGRLPIARMAMPSAGLVFMLGFAVGIPGFLDYAVRSGGATSDLMLRASHEALRGRASEMAPAGAWGLSIVTLAAFAFLTPKGLLASYLVASGVLRFLAAAASEPLGDPLLSVGDQLVQRLAKRWSDERFVSTRERLEGPATADVLVSGKDLGFPEAELVLVASRRKPEWQAGVVVVTALKRYRIGSAFDRSFRDGLRRLYPLSELPMAEVMRRSVACELPRLSRYDPVSRTTSLLPEPDPWQET